MAGAVKESRPHKRMLVTALHIRTDEQGNESLNTNREYQWTVSSHATFADGERVRRTLPEIGSIVEARTRFGMQQVVVVGARLVANETTDDLEELLRVKGLRQIIKYTGEKLNPELTQQLDRYLSTHTPQTLSNGQSQSK